MNNGIDIVVDVIGQDLEIMKMIRLIDSRYQNGRFQILQVVLIRKINGLNVMQQI